jgi:hypothetical protein
MSYARVRTSRRKAVSVDKSFARWGSVSELFVDSILLGARSSVAVLASNFQAPYGNAHADEAWLVMRKRSRTQRRNRCEGTT